jgi:Hemopexin/Matrixin
MGVGAALFSGSKCYIFDGRQYIRVTRGETGPGTVDPGYPAPISKWGWPAGFGQLGIDAALYSGSKAYFFDGDRYIRVTRGETGPGTVDPGYPASIASWGWPAGFGASGIDAALYSGSKCYFFDGDRYIRVTRGETGPGTVDPGYPKRITEWGWPGRFGRFGIDAALYSGSKCYFFDGNQYIRVTRGDTGPGTVDAGYPADISNWNWPGDFARGERVGLSFKSLLPVTDALGRFIQRQYTENRRLYLKSGLDVRFGSTEDLSGDASLEPLLALDVGACLLGVPTAEHDLLFAHRDGVPADELVVYIVQTLVGGSGNLLGCATHPAGQPGAAIVQSGALWLTAHEVGHVLGLRHASSTSDDLMFPTVGWTNVPPDLSDSEAATMVSSVLTVPV